MVHKLVKRGKTKVLWMTQPEVDEKTIKKHG
jgi:hypothetical protein